MFFFQAEDGIRDLVRSRGLGDVYKRQGAAYLISRDDDVTRDLDLTDKLHKHGIQTITVQPVSYTHLTLPTSDLV